MGLRRYIGDKPYPHILRAFLVVLAFSLAGCGTDDDDDDRNGVPDGQADTDAPSVEISFPGLFGLTDAETLLVAGTATDDSLITSVRVNGVAATSDDGYASWRVNVPLNPGSNTLVVEAVDEFANVDSDAATIVIESGPAFVHPIAIALDDRDDRILVVDSALDAIIAVDPVTGARRTFSGGSEPDGENFFQVPNTIALDYANNRALVADGWAGSVFAIDLDSGAQSVLTDDSFRFVGIRAGTEGIVTDLPRNRALVLRSSYDYLVAVDLVTGEKTAFSQDDSAYRLNFTEDIDLDPANSRAWILDSAGALVAVDLDTGIQTPLDGSLINPISSAMSCVVDPDNDRILVAQRFSGTIYAVDSVTGESVILSDDVNPNPNVLWNEPEDLALDPARNRVLVADSEIPGIIAADLDTGQRTLLSGETEGIPNSINPYVQPNDMALDEANNRVLITNGNRFGRPFITDQNSLLDGAFAQVIAMDLLTGERSVFADVSQSFIARESWRVFPVDVELDPENGIALVLAVEYSPYQDDKTGDYYWSHESHKLLAIDLETGAQSDMSNLLPPLAEEDRLIAILPDVTNNRLLIIGNLQISATGSTTFANRGPAIVAVDRETAEWEVLSDNMTPNANDPFYQPLRMLIDEADNRVIVADGGLQAILEVDLATGTRRVLTTADEPREAPQNLYNPRNMVLDADNNRVLVVDLDFYFDRQAALLAVDLATGERTIVSSIAMPNAHNPFDTPSGMVFDKSRNRVLVSDVETNAVYAVDLETGARVIVSQ
jgi:DNA-binding beta-propeller fold protein YncE